MSRDCDVTKMFLRREVVIDEQTVSLAQIHGDAADGCGCQTKCTPKKPYCMPGPETRLMFAGVRLFGNSRNPGYLVEGFPPAGTNSGDHQQDRFKEQGSGPSLARCGGSQAGRNSKELGAVAGLCGDVFDYMQLAPLLQGTNHHHVDKTQAGPPHQASLPARHNRRQHPRPSCFPTATHLRPQIELLLDKTSVPIYVPWPTRCLDFGPLSPASHARSPPTVTTTTATQHSSQLAYHYLWLCCPN